MNSIITKFTKTNIAKVLAIAASALVIAGVIATAPINVNKVHAGFNPVQIVDPFCLWSGCGKSSSNKTITNNTTNNSGNINSPGGTVNNTTGGTTVVPVIAQTPVYNYNYPYYGNNSTSQLNATCYATPTSGSVGDSITWRVSAYGGNGSYFYSWTGTDGLSGNGSNIYMTYNTPGSKNATVNITSGNQTIARNCDTSVIIYDYNHYNNNNSYNYNYNYNNGYNGNYYNGGYNYNYTPLTVSCSAGSSFVPVGQYVNWTSSVTGGNGYYTYRWTGTDNLLGYNSVISTIYNASGPKYATLTVTSNGQSIVRDCNGSVTVGQQNYNGNQSGNLDLACYADADRVRTGVPVTWAVEATGGDGANYTYAWTGTDGLASSQRSAVTTYSTTGTKSATVTVTSNGQSQSKLCGNVVTVVSGQSSSNGSGNTNVQNPTNTNDNLSAASLFSLKNVPWGWVAVLIILILFAMVSYLLFNRTAIK